MALPADLDFSNDRNASPERMNRAMGHIDARLRVAELPARSLDEVLAQLQAIGLQRIADALGPVYAGLVSVSSLGAIFEASSTTPAPIATGRITLEVSAETRGQYAYSSWIAAVSRADSRNALTGRKVSYDRDTGALELDVVLATGSGTHADWWLMPTAPPFVMAATLDAGSDDDPTLGPAPFMIAPGSLM